MVKPTRADLKLFSFAILALTPLGLLICASLWGGPWIWAMLLYLLVFSCVLDQIIPMVSDGSDTGGEFPNSDRLLVIIGVCSCALLPAVAYVVGHAPGLTILAKIALIFGAGLWLGQVGHPCAHELIHRPNKVLFRLGQFFYAMVFFGQHTSAHRLVHHIHVATPQDPNSAREGEGFYHFYPRAWMGSFRKGYQAETKLRSRGHKARLHPYAVNFIIGLASLVLAISVGGIWGTVAWIAIASHVQLQILVSDYVQHYGLQRRKIGPHRYEPVNASHAWNSAHWFSSTMMLNAPRHSDHHAHPSRSFTQLVIAPEAPRLPWPLPIACAMAFYPPLWRRRIRPLLHSYQTTPAPTLVEAQDA